MAIHRKFEAEVAADLEQNGEDLQVLIVFDLDGTLIDSSKDLSISMNATREHFELPPLDPVVIQSYVGNGAGVLVRRAMGANASDEIVQDALQFFLKFYRMHALENTKLY